MAKYTHEAGAVFPDGIIDLTHYKNADSTVQSLVQQIKTYQKAGNYTAAQNLINSNINTLKSYIFDTAKVNQYVEEIRNLEIFTKSKKQQIYYQINMPNAVLMDIQDVWIGPKS